MTQKHSKKDYANLRELTIGDIFESVQVAPKKVMYQEDKINYQDMVKIELKKKK